MIVAIRSSLEKVGVVLRSDERFNPISVSPFTTSFVALSFLRVDILSTFSSVSIRLFIRSI